MSDLIDRQDAINAVAAWTVEEPTYLINRIENIPSALPERKVGKWVRISPAKIYECSECGQNVMTGDIDVYKYCHGCGTKMEGSE